MRIRALVIVTAVTASTIVAVAPGALAVVSPGTIYVRCNAGTVEARTAAAGGGSVVSSISWTSASESLTIVNEQASTLFYSLPVLYTIAASTSGQINPLGSTSTNMNMAYSGCANGLNITLVPPAGGGGAETPESPEPLVQQFGMPTSGTCDVAAPAILNWGGAGSGGWGSSWAEWMNGGAGGAVCTRTLVYSNALGHWIVG